jgi:peptidoglycan/LPS O-acetylase OafA/YrhL
MRSEMLMTENQPQEATTAGHRVTARAVAVVALGAVALIHLIDAPSKFQETPYVGGLYVALMAGALLAAAILLRRDDRRTWAAVVALNAGAIVAYALSRTTGLPLSSHDIGHWGEPLGTAALFVEGVLVVLGATSLSEA